MLSRHIKHSNFVGRRILCMQQGQNMNTATQKNRLGPQSHFYWFSSPSLIVENTENLKTCTPRGEWKGMMKLHSLSFQVVLLIDALTLHFDHEMMGCGEKGKKWQKMASNAFIYANVCALTTIRYVIKKKQMIFYIFFGTYFRDFPVQGKFFSIFAASSGGDISGWGGKNCYIDFKQITKLLQAQNI